MGFQEWLYDEFVKWEKKQPRKQSYSAIIDALRKFTSTLILPTKSA